MNADTFPRLLDGAASSWSDRLWLTDGRRDCTFSDLAAEARAVARGLLALGVSRGDRVAIFASNRAEWFTFEYGAALIGAPVVPLNTRFTVAELEYVLAKAEPAVLLWEGRLRGQDTTSFLSQLVPAVSGEGWGDALAARGSRRCAVVALGDADWPPGVVAWTDFLGAAVTISSREVDHAVGLVTGDDIGLVVFTSGTTGRPKGAMLRQRGLVGQMRTWTRHLGFGPTDRAILASPIFWGFGCAVNALVPLHSGAGIVLHDAFDARAWLVDIDRWQCTFLQGVPSQYQLLLDHPESEQYDLSGIRLVQIGGAPSADTLIRRLLERAPKAVMISAYGLTEGGFVNTATDPGGPIELVLSSVGRALPGNEVTVREPNGEAPVARGEVGELCLRGESVMREYLDDPAATAETIRDGWLRTGDLATIDEEGVLRIVGRLKDMYIKGGMNVYPPEVENALSSHPAVAQVAVTGVPDERFGEVGVAWVVRRANRLVSGEDLLGHARERVADYKVPAVVRFVDELPVNASGKVTKYVLVERWRGDATAQPSSNSV